MSDILPDWDQWRRWDRRQRKRRSTGGEAPNQGELSREPSDELSRAFWIRVRQLGLRNKEGTNLLQLNGRIRKSQVTIKRGMPRMGGYRWTIKVLNSNVPSSLNIGPERVVGKLLKTVRGGDVLTGDSDFDAKMLLRGEELEILALMSKKTRQTIRKTIERGAKVRDGVISWNGVDDDTPPRVLAVACTLASLAERLTEMAQHELVELLSEHRQWLSLLSERVLIGLLDVRQLRTEAINRLSDIGTETCVAPIAEVATGLFVDRRLKQAGQEAIAKVIGRVGGLKKGGLALAEQDGEGQLSVSRRAGTLSTTEDDT